MVHNLNDTNQSVFVIPYAGDENAEDEIDQENTESGFRTDLPRGDDLRWDAYRASWTKCLNRIQSLVHALHEPVVKAVVEQVNSAFSNTLPALPQPELPVIAVTNPSLDNVFLCEVVSQLDSEDILVAHLRPSDCPNLMTAMKTLMNGFMEQSSNRPGYKSSAHSLAPYDIQVLHAWYDALVEDRGNSKPNLVVILHDFEQADPSIMQDIFYICSLHLPDLPLVFIIFLSSPQTPSYLHIAYPRSTLALLRIHPINVPSGTQILEEIFMKTFVDLDYDPDIVFGPDVLEYLIEYFTRYSPSIDAALNILQLAHLKHFTDNPFTAFTCSTPATPTLKDPSSFPFLDVLLTRLHPTDSPTPTNWQGSNLKSLMKSLDDARTKFYDAARDMRLGFGLLRLLNEFLTCRGYKGLEWGGRRDSQPVLPRIFIKLLRDGLNRDINSARMIISKLKPAEIRDFIEVLVDYFEGMPEAVAETKEKTREKIVEFKSALEVEDESDSDLEASTTKNAKQVANDVAKWMSDHLSKLTRPLDGNVLWDLWYTGELPFPSMIHNPSVRSSIISGLLHPRGFCTLSERQADDEDEDEDALWRLPDTSILFHRYLESGKMINVYDWFESFSVVLETQRREQLKAKASKEKAQARGQRSPTKKESPHKKGHSRSPTKSPTKANGKSPSKGKGKGVTAEEDEEVIEDEEKWKLAVQARFMRALHELDYLGFIKHTGRKPDHVLRTVFDIPE